jgi:hypothetical protein
MKVVVENEYDFKRLHELYEEFMALWRRLQAFYLDAAAGFEFVFQHVRSEQAKARNFVEGSELDSEAFQDTRSFTYAEIFDESFCTSAIHRATQGEVKARNAANGANFTTLGQVCLVSFYDFWNDYLRREYVVAKGHLDPNERDDEVVKARLRAHASHDLWGDMHYLRVSIVHNRGIATSDVAKCKLMKWFKPGDPIFLTPSHMRAIFMGMLIYSNELFSEHLPKTHFYFD